MKAASGEEGLGAVGPERGTWTTRDRVGEALCREETGVSLDSSTFFQDI